MKKKMHKERDFSREEVRERVNKARTEIPNVNLDTVLWFGKYRGSTLAHAIDTDPEYIEWSLKQNIFNMDPSAALRLSLAKRAAAARKRDEDRQCGGHGFDGSSNTYTNYTGTAEFVCDAAFFNDILRKANPYAEQEQRQQRQQEHTYSQERGEREPEWENVFERIRRAQAQAHAHARANAQNQIRVREVVSPAAQWDHLPEKAKYSAILRLGEVIDGGKLTKENLKKQYRKVMLEYHPDKVGNAGPLITQLAHEMTTRINAAWEYFTKVYGVE